MDALTEESPFRVVIFGSISIKDPTEVFAVCDRLLANKKRIEIISAKNEGTASIGEMYAKRCGITFNGFPNDFGKFGTRAPYFRNEEMSNHAEAAILFWDMQSKVTKHLIEVCNRKNLKTKVYEFITNNRPAFTKPTVVDSDAGEPARFDARRFRGEEAVLQ